MEKKCDWGRPNLILLLGVDYLSVVKFYPVRVKIKSYLFTVIIMYKIVVTSALITYD